MSFRNSSFRARPTALAALALSLLFALACAGTPEESAPVDVGAVLQPDDVVVAAQQSIATGPRLSGTLEPSAKAVLRAETAGSLVDLRVDVGDVVSAGQILARIDNDAAASGLASARSSVDSAASEVTIAERELARTIRLVEAGAVPGRDKDSAESRVTQAKAALAGAKAQQAAQGDQADATVVKSPIAGVIAMRDVSAGDVVAPGSPLFTVIEPSSLRLEASVPASAVGSLTVGTPVFFEVQGYPGRTFEGRIDRVAPAVDPVSRQIPVFVSVPNEGGELLAGLFAEGRVATERREGIVVPADAVDGEGPRPWVLKVVGGKAERVEVQLGLVDDHADTIEIIAGVAAGDTLVLAGARDVPSGGKVEIATVKPPTPVGNGG